VLRLPVVARVIVIPTEVACQAVALCEGLEESLTVAFPFPSSPASNKRCLDPFDSAQGKAFSRHDKRYEK
jgi:hypothetical protein